MSYSNMNAKYSSVEDTVVSKNHILSVAKLPVMSNKYQILSGTCSPLAVTTVPTGNAVAVAPLNILDDEGKQLYIPTGAYIEKVIISPKSALSPVTVSLFDVQLGYRTTSNVYVNALPATPTVVAGTLLAFVNVAGTTTPLTTNTLGGVAAGNTPLLSTDSLYQGAASPNGTVLNQGVVAFPDAIVSSSVGNFPVGVVTGGAFTAGEVRVTLFIVCP